MRLAARLQAAWRSFLEDIFSESVEADTAPPGALSPGSSHAACGGNTFSQEMLDRTLSEAQRQLDTLHVELADALSRQQRAHQELKEAQADASRLSDAVDDALRNEQDDQARARLAQLLPLQKRIGHLEARCRSNDQLVDLLRTSIQTQQAQLEQALRKSQELLEKERTAETLRSLSQLHNDLHRHLASLQSDLDAHLHHLPPPGS